MGILRRFADQFEPPSLELYQCSSCGSRFEEPHSSCPECDKDLEADEPSEHPIYYWGPI